MTRRPVRPIVALTRDEAGNARCARTLRALGARPLLLPTIRIAPPEDAAPLTSALETLHTFDWIVLTSAHAVDASCEHAAWNRAWPAEGGRVRVASIGAATTARLRDRNIGVDLTISKGGGAGLASALLDVRRHEAMRPTRVLWPRSEIAADDVSRILSAAGIEVSAPVAYRTVAVRPPGLDRFLTRVQAGRIAAVAFCSPSSVRGLAAWLPGGTLAILAGRTLVASLGPQTSAAIAALGARVDLESRVPHADALMADIFEHVSSQITAV